MPYVPTRMITWFILIAGRHLDTTKMGKGMTM
jgi:hypothetical protein